VYVEGRLKTDAWTDKQTGQKRYRTKIVAEQVTFLGPKRSSNSVAEEGEPAAA
jgi:single-strand DNA-binding protein